MNPVHVVATVAGLSALCQSGLIVWASMTGGNVVTAMAAMGGVPWELTTLTDLGIGLALVAGWIALLQRSAWRSLPWWLGLCLLGNLAAALFVVWRCCTHSSLRSALLDHAEPL